MIAEVTARWMNFYCVSACYACRVWCSVCPMLVLCLHKCTYHIFLTC